MMLSESESAHAWFLKSLDVGSVVSVPALKGTGKVVELNGCVKVDMLDGPYYPHRFDVEWKDVADIP